MKILHINFVWISFLFSIFSIFNQNVYGALSLGRGYRAVCSDEIACSHLALEPLDNSAPSSSSSVSSKQRNFGNDQQLKKRQISVGGGSGGNAADQFVFSITCSPPAKTYYPSSVDFCTNAKAVFLKAASIFSSVFQFSAPIQVQVNLVSFCGSSSSGCGSTLGYGKPSNFWEMKGGSNPSDIVYPQALVKQQLTSPSDTLLASFDIEIRFNLDFPYYFSQDILSQNGYGSSFHSIKKDEYDFLHLTMHEMIHGLGLVSFLEPDDLLKSQFALSQLYPFLKNADLSNMLSSPVAIADNKASFQALGIFDYTMQSTVDGSSLYSVMNTVKLMFDSSASSATQQSALNAARQLYTLATSRTAVISQYQSGPAISKNGMVLYTAENPFDLSSSLVHADPDLYQRTEEFLITPSVLSGISMEAEVNSYGGHFGTLGKRTIAILNKLGYRLQPSVSPVLNTLLANDGAIVAYYLYIPAVLSLLMIFTL